MKEAKEVMHTLFQLVLCKRLKSESRMVQWLAFSAARSVGAETEVSIPRAATFFGLQSQLLSARSANPDACRCRRCRRIVFFPHCEASATAQPPRPLSFCTATPSL